MKNRLNRLALLGVGMIAVAAAAGAACGDDGNDTKSPTAAASQAAATTAATKAAATSAPTSGATSAATSAATKPAATATQGAASGATTLNLIAKDTLWDKKELKAKPGKVTIQIDNQDDGIPHNIHAYKGTDNKGQDMGKTELEAGPIKQTLAFDVTAGAYFLVCEVHPATMFAKLEVE